MGRKTTQPTTTTGLTVGDDFELDGHCMVAFPDGSVVTASRSIKLVQEGTYRIIPNGKGRTRTIHVKKTEA